MQNAIQNLQSTQAGIDTLSISKSAMVDGMLDVCCFYTQLGSLESSSLCVPLGFQSIVHSPPFILLSETLARFYFGIILGAWTPSASFIKYRDQLQHQAYRDILRL